MLSIWLCVTTIFSPELTPMLRDRPAMKKITAPSKRKWNSGSRISFRMGTCIGSLLRRVPDGRSIGALLHRHRHFRRQLDAKVFGVVRRPAWGRNLQHTDVVEC